MTPQKEGWEEKVKFRNCKNTRREGLMTFNEDLNICWWHYFFGNRLFYFQTKTEKHDASMWKYSSKIKVPQCSCCHYVYVYVLCMYLCIMCSHYLHRSSYQAEIWTMKSTCDCLKTHFFLFWNFHFLGRYAHFIWFSQFHAYNTFTLTYHDDWYIKSNPWTSTKRCI